MICVLNLNVLNDFREFFCGEFRTKEINFRLNSIKLRHHSLKLISKKNSSTCSNRTINNRWRMPRVRWNPDRAECSTTKCRRRARSSIRRWANQWRRRRWLRPNRWWPHGRRRSRKRPIRAECSAPDAVNPLRIASTWWPWTGRGTANVSGAANASGPSTRPIRVSPDRTASTARTTTTGHLHIHFKS